MLQSLQEARRLAVKQYQTGRSVASICATFNRTKQWLYKWANRFDVADPNWSNDTSRKPHVNPNKSSTETESAVRLVRLDLYNKDVFCGSQAIRGEMEDMGVSPLPSLRTIDRIICRLDLTNKKAGRYTPKGTPYPSLPKEFANQVHQADFVGPLHLKGPLRFYGLNVVDLASRRCATQPVTSRSGQNVIDSFLAIWSRMGIPQNVQIDNEMAFYGSPQYPRGMGALIRLCLNNNVELWFIPPSEPWRNGIVEKFNDHYQQKFIHKITMHTMKELEKESLRFENKHNDAYRYSALKGSTPTKTFAGMKCSLRLPKQEKQQQHPLKKPTKGKYHLVRLIRSDRRLDVFGEKFPMHQDLEYEYVVATVNVKEQQLEIYHDNKLIDGFEYKLR
jgi:transposase InsO family protein